MIETDVIWRTTVGSHMWKMNHEGSDIDIFEVFIQDMYEILAGRQIRGGEEEHWDHPKTDKTAYEIGHVIEQLQKGNINFLWGLMSWISGYDLWRADPTWHFDCKEFHAELKQIVLDNLSKNYIHAITGLARRNLAKYFGIKVKTKDEKIEFVQVSDGKLEPTDYKYTKKLKLMFRTLLQGMILLTENRIEFPNVGKRAINLIILENLYKDVIDEYKLSDLPEKPDSKPFDDFLVRIRLRYMDVIHPQK